jgi:hypothetical protein
MAAAPRQQERQPSGGENILLFSGFTGLNTQASRLGIEDTQMAICDGFFCLGTDNLRVIPDNGAPIYTAPANRTISFYDFGNLGATSYCIVFLSDGSVVAVNTSTFSNVTIAPAGTILNPSSTATDMTQSGSKYLLIVSNQPNGYFVWDGTTFYSSGQLVPGATGPGPISSSSIANAGSGYAVGDTGTVTTGTADATWVVTSVSGTGAVTGYRLTFAGTGYVTLNSVATVDGPGLMTWTNVFALPIAWLNATGGTIQWAGGNTGTGTGFTLNIVVAAAVMPSGVKGTCVETYQGYVWIGNGTFLINSAPGSVTDFSAANGGGSSQFLGSALRVHFTKLVSANGYLYLIGDSSTSYIANAVTSGSPSKTTYAIQDADPEVGSPWPNTISVLGSNIVFANSWGAHVAYGGRTTKVSDALDGVYATVSNFGGQIPSAGKAILFGRRVWVLLLPVIDPYTLQQVNKLFLWDEKRWQSCQQSLSLTFVSWQEIDSVLTAYGTDGTVIVPLFARPGASVQKVVRSKFWSAPPGFAHVNAASRLWGVLQVFQSQATSVTVSIDSEHGPTAYTIPAAVGSLLWTNNSGGLISWTGAGGGAMAWTGAGGSIVVLPPLAVGQNGVLLGFTLTTNASDLSLLGLSTMAADVQFRG